MSKELVNKHGVVRICSRCKKLAVRRVKSEWLCRTCLEERKKRQLKSVMEHEEQRSLYDKIGELEDSNLQEILYILLHKKI